jgi:CCR4-NOT transcription complex subunit 3
MKKVDEGVDLFDEIWEKVYSAEQQNQKEKYEMDLKKEIKKLQRLRDQIKTWIGSSDVKDKDPLLDGRKLIETKMEQFKICEKETKTKTYSKEGLARQERLDPQEQAKRDCGDWIATFVDQLQQMVEDREVEIEQLMVGKGKKTNKQQIEQFQQYVIHHKFHISKLEGVMRLVNNDVLDVEVVESIKEDLEYYMESFEDEDYQQAYDEEFFYEPLGLDDLDVVNVDRVTHIAQSAAKSTVEDDLASKSSSKGSDVKNSKKSVLATVIPLTIGRARASSGGKEEPPPVAVKAATPSKGPRSLSAGSSGSNVGPTPTTIPASRPTPLYTPGPVPPPGGASMAAILKRETEQQEKERQKVSRDSSSHWTFLILFDIFWKLILYPLI